MTGPSANPSDAVLLAPWTELELKVPTTGGEATIKGLVHALVPGLAVTSMVFGLFDVTHIATGKLIAKGYERMWNAALVAVEFALCADWTQDAAGISAELARTKDEPCGNPKATSTTLGVTTEMTKGDLVQLLRSASPVCDEFPWEDESPDNQVAELLRILRARSIATKDSETSDA